MPSWLRPMSKACKLSSLPKRTEKTNGLMSRISAYYVISSKMPSFTSNAGAASLLDMQKNPSFFLAAIQIRCIALWANIS